MATVVPRRWRRMGTIGEHHGILLVGMGAAISSVMASLDMVLSSSSSP